MARPKKEGMDYFPHDTDAANDEKIEVMRAMYGNDGYAFYFILCERVYRTSDAELDVSKLPLKMALASKIAVPLERFEEMIKTAMEVDLFDSAEYESKQVLTSHGIKKRFGEVNKIRSKWRDKKNNAGIFPGENPIENGGENGQQTGESKVKQSKVKQSKANESSVVDAPHKNNPVSVPDNAEDLETELFDTVFDCYATAAKKDPVHCNPNDVIRIRQLLGMGIPVDYICEMIRYKAQGVARITSFNYFFDTIAEGWERLQNGTDQHKPYGAGNSRPNRTNTGIEPGSINNRNVGKWAGFAEDE